MNKVYLVYYFPNTESSDKDFTAFVADEKKDLEKQFIKYAKWAWDTDLTEEDIDGIYEISGDLQDCKGNYFDIDYKLTIKKDE